MTVDLAPLVQAAVGIAALAVATFGSWALQRLATRLGIQLSAERQARLDDAMTKAAQAGAVAAENLASTRGWDHPEVRNQMIGQGLQYLVARFPDALKQCGLDPADPADAARIRGAIERVLPVAAAPIAASPITTSGPAAAQPGA